MANQEPAEPVPSRAKLQDTPERAERFHQYGLDEFPLWRIGVEEGVHANTVCTFLKMAPLSRARHAEGKAEAKARHKRDGARKAAAGKADRPAAGDICPTCGGRIGFAEETVTFTAAELAGARKDFAELIDRHLAARDAAAAETEGQ